jgi:hypothetical protein
MKIEMIGVEKIIPYIQNAKAHPEAQVKKLAGAIAEFKWDQPIVVDRDMVIIKGHGRLLAAQALGHKEVPVIIRDDLSPAQVKAARIADNKIAESEWFPETLALELQALSEMDFDLSLTGFEDWQIEQMIGEGGENDPEKEWEGMPEYEHEDKTAFKSIHIHFINEKDVQNFAKLIGYEITVKTRAIWFPKAEIGRTKNKEYSED